MKAYYSLFIMAGFIITCFSCQKDDIQTYSPDNTPQILFDYAYERMTVGLIIDNTFMSFAYDKEEKSDSTMSVKVRIMGNIADYDREFNYMVVDTSSTGKPGVNYEILTSVIDSGSIYGDLKLKFYNTPDLQDTTYRVCVRLLPNENFGTSYDRFEFGFLHDIMDPLEYYISFNNNADMPNLWADYPTYYKYGLGEFSNVKFKFILDLFSWERSFFEYDPSLQTAKQAFDERVPGGISTLQAWAAIMNQALNEYELEHGERLVDEYGNEVKSGQPNL